MATKCSDMHEAIVLAINASDLKPLAKVRIKMLMRSKVICALVCQRVENRLIEEAVIAETACWDPESWDWDKVIARLKELISFIVEIVLIIVNLFI